MGKFLKPPRPASTAVDITQLLAKQALIEIDLIALLPKGRLKKELISTDKVPRPIAGYSQAIRAGNLIFAAGELATDFANPIAPEARVKTDYWVGSEIKKQTEYTLKKLETILKAADSSLKNVVKADVYLTDINDLFKMDEVWRHYFPKHPPARTIIPVKTLGWLGCRIEITLIAVTAGTDRQVIHTGRAPKPLTHESQAIKTGNLVFISGQMAADEEGLAGEARIDPDYPYYELRIKKQVEYIINNTRHICEAAGIGIDSIVRKRAFHTDLRDFSPSWEVWNQYFPKGPPASTTIEVPSPLSVPGCTVVTDMIGFVP